MQSLENKEKIRMASQVDAPSSVNVTGTDRKIANWLTQTDSPDVHGWQPIETGPKDGSKFWGRCGDDAIAMFWHPKFGQFISSFRRMQLHNGATFTDSGETYSDHSPVVHKPTHWQQLPEPPVLP